MYIKKLFYILTAISSLLILISCNNKPDLKIGTALTTFDRFTGEIITTALNEAADISATGSEVTTSAPETASDTVSKVTSFEVVNDTTASMIFTTEDEKETPDTRSAPETGSKRMPVTDDPATVITSRVPVTSMPVTSSVITALTYAPVTNTTVPKTVADTSEASDPVTAKPTTSASTAAVTEGTQATVSPAVDPAILYPDKEFEVITTGSSINLRSGPGASYEKTGVSLAGDRFRYLGLFLSESGTRWYKIGLDDGREAYISGTYSALREKRSGDEILTYIDSVANEFGAVGIQVAAIKDGKLFYTCDTGWAKVDEILIDDDSAFRLASLSKVVLAITAMKMSEEGIVNIDTPISEYFNRDFPKEVTLRNILNHCSTIKSGDYLDSPEQITSRLESPEAYSEGTPGSRAVWWYNNYAIGVGGSALEAALGASVDSYLKEKICLPLGIEMSYFPSCFSDTSRIAYLYDRSKRVTLSPGTLLGFIDNGALCNMRYFAGGIVTSASEYAKLIAMLASKGEYDGTRILSPESVEEIEKSVFEADQNGGTFDQALILRYKENLYGQDRLYYHTGNAYSLLSLASYNPDTRNGVVVITTGASAERDSQGVYAVCSKITEFLYKDLLDAE